jgi:hypothetical protein
MPNRISRSWSSSVNNTVLGATQIDKYKDAFLKLHVAIKAAGHTVSFSSNGVTADANDNIASASDVVFGTEGSQAHSYVVYQLKPGFNGNSTGYLLIDCDEPNTETSPQNLDFYSSISPYSLDGTPLVNRPVTAGSEETILTRNLIGSTANDPHTIHYGFSTIGDLWFCCSRDGTGDADFGFLMCSLTGGEGVNQFVIYAASTNAFKATSFASSSIMVFYVDNAVASSPLMTSLAFDFTNWSAGRTTSGKPVSYPIALASNSSTQARPVGGVVDIRAAAPDNISNEVFDDEDSDALRLVSISDLWVPMQSAQFVQPAGLTL